MNITKLILLIILGCYFGNTLAEIDNVKIELKIFIAVVLSLVLLEMR